MPVRIQTGCGRNRSVASSGAAMVEAPGSGCSAGERRSHVGGRERSVGGAERADPVFQPSSGGEPNGFRCPIILERFSSPGSGLIEEECGW